jgi:ADP-heptose:LPS heptosyltransferase
MKIVLVRQSPGIGDALLLGPLVREIKAKHSESFLTVVTDFGYAGGALKELWKSTEGVDAVHHVPVKEWTTTVFDRFFYTQKVPPPCAVSEADLAYDCNTAFVEFEQTYVNGNVPYGIAEFWLRNFGFWHEGIDMLPKYKVNPLVELEVEAWLQGVKKPLIGIVLKAGHYSRTWDFNGLSETLADWCLEHGLEPVSIDQHKALPGLSCVGQSLPFVAALLKRCKLVVTPDSGLMHLAQAVGTPTVSLWGILDPDLRVRGYNTIRVPQVSLGYCQEPCQCKWAAQKWSCMRRLTLEMITNAITDYIEHDPPHSTLRMEA